MNSALQDTYGMYANNLPDDGPGPTLMGAGTLIGNEVYNRQENHLGEIKEIMLDMRTGNISYAVLTFTGIFGLGAKFFAVPWAALELDTENKRFILDTSKERLETAPGFDPDCWPDMADEIWAKEIHHYYGTQQYADAVN